MTHVFKIHLDNLTPCVLAKGTSSEVIQGAIAKAMSTDRLPAVPVDARAASVRLGDDKRQWLQKQVAQHNLGAEAEAARACIAAQTVTEVVHLVQQYKTDEASIDDVAHSLWLAMGYAPTSHSPAGTASSRADKGDP